ETLEDPRPLEHAPADAGDLQRAEPGPAAPRRAPDLVRAAPSVGRSVPSRGRIDEVEPLVDAAERGGQIRIHLAERVERGSPLQDDHRQAPAVETAELALDLVDADFGAADDGHPVVGNWHADELVDLLEVIELLGGIDEAIDGAQAIGGVLHLVDL